MILPGRAFTENALRDLGKGARSDIEYLVRTLDDGGAQRLRRRQDSRRSGRGTGGSGDGKALASIVSYASKPSARVSRAVDPTRGVDGRNSGTALAIPAMA